MMARLLLQTLTLLILVADAMSGQEIKPRNALMISIDSDPRGAEIFRGDSLLGTTPTLLPEVGLDTLILFHPARNAWNAQQRIVTGPFLSAEQGITLVRFDRGFVISSNPSRSAVLIGDSLLGHTPLLLRAPALPIELRVRKPGFASSFVLLTNDGPDTVSVLLQPDGNGPGGAIASTGFKTSTIALPAAIGLVSGAAAIILKQQADRKYNDYLAHDDASALSDARRYDLYSGIALFLLELSFAYFAWLLFMQS